MQKQKGISTLAGIIIIVIVAVVAFGGVFGYQYFSTKTADQLQVQSDQQNQNQQQNTETNPNSQTAGWQTYTNAEYGFSFQYPEKGRIESKTEDGYALAWVPSFWPPKVQVISIDKDPIEEGCKISKYYQQFINQKDSWLFSSQSRVNNTNYDLYITKLKGAKSGEISNCYVTEKNGNYYVFRSSMTSTVDSDFILYEDFSNLMQKIVSTFKFTK